LQEAELDKVKQEAKKTKELIEKSDDLPQEDELYNRLARATNNVTAKDNLIQVMRLCRIRRFFIAIARHPVNTCT